MYRRWCELEIRGPLLLPNCGRFYILVLRLLCLSPDGGAVDFSTQNLESDVIHPHLFSTMGSSAGADVAETCAMRLFHLVSESQKSR
jgi:hypothetical protein